MKIQLSDHFNYRRLIRFVIPSVLMMIFTSIYGVVDGLFVSNFAGKTAFAAVNLIMPVLMVLGTVGFMFGAGGSAIVSKTLGEGNTEKANKYFSMLVYATIISGIILTIAGFIFLRPVAVLLGASGDMLEGCVLYGRIIIAALTAFMLQNVFQSFLITAEKPHFGLIITVAAGCTNMVLDFLFVGVFKWGIAGAAAATGLSQCVGGIIPLVYFLGKNNSTLRLTKTGFEKKVIIKACTNGSSELMTNISMSLVNILYNFQLMKFAGEDGLAAYGVIMYAGFIFAAAFIGYSIGCAPVIGYNFGAKNHMELKNLFKKSMIIISVTGVAMLLFGEIMAHPLAKVFVGYDAELLALTSRGFKIYSVAYIIWGYNIFGSAFFTALNNGLVSAIISFLRTLVFQIISVLILPMILGIDGIWMAIIAAELMSLVVTIAFLVNKKKVYNY